MAITSGFFNSLNGDRKYDADDIGSMFDGVFNDGVFRTIGKCFVAEATSTMAVNIPQGRAWFNGSWLLNDAVQSVTVASSNPLYSRIDAIVLDFNKDVATRANSIKYVKGVPASHPSKPTLINTFSHKQFAICYITVDREASVITQNKIENVIGTSATPFIQAIDANITTDALLTQWRTDFSIWFDKIKDQLSEDAAGHLQNEIDTLSTELNNIASQLRQVKGGLKFDVSPSWWNPTSHLGFNFGFYVSWGTVTDDVILDFAVNEDGLTADQIAEQKEIVSTMSGYSQKGGFGFRIVEKPKINLKIIVRGVV